jgi:hypothetical protein
MTRTHAPRFGALDRVLEKRRQNQRQVVAAPRPAVVVQRPASTRSEPKVPAAGARP